VSWELVVMRTIVMVTACGFVLAGCGSESGAEAPPAPVPSAAGPSSSQSSPAITTPSGLTTSPGSPAVSGTGIKLASSDFGMILFDKTGQAIYLFDKEKTSTSACYGACAEAWPPVVTTGRPVAVGGVKQSLLGTTKRTDGTTQITYGGHPLYYYAHEGKNEVKCHNITGFGGLWLVVTATGDAARF
jgi:predicted lipoprotein with Yx(FWY)xxD motif